MIQTMEKKKLIIENQTDLPMKEILIYINFVIQQGRISNDGTQYCYLTAFDNGYAVASRLNKDSDKLIIYKSDKNKISVQEGDIENQSTIGE